MTPTRTTRLLLATLFAAPAIGLSTGAAGQIIINEGNAVGVNGQFLQTDVNKPYEGYDYGSIAHSGNNNDPNAVTNPGNPFPADVDSGTGGNQTTLPNGWNGTTGFARIQGNGGDWLEFVVTEDNLDIRGWTLYWENDDADSNGNEYGGGIVIRDGIVGETATERGQIKFTQNAAWSNLRAGTIITISEDNSINEIRDGYDSTLFGGAPGSNIHDTGFNYDLNTDLSFDPINDDWHIHFHLDESQTDNGNATEYFEAFSNIKVDNDDWRAVFFDETNTTIADDADDDTKLRSALDLSTGIVGTFIGESAANWGGDTGSGGLNNTEVISNNADPTVDGTASNNGYEDIDWSTFGAANMYNVGSNENTLEGVQDFSAIRAWLDSILPGDADLDGDVDSDDFNILAFNFGEPGGWTQGNFDGDATVDSDDFNILAFNFGAGSPTSISLEVTSVPEPASLTLLGVAGLALLRRRRV
ncbi:MAG: PEP-CTERM sorting domain-containing protein [Planctomycetota bacterium]